MNENQNTPKPNESGLGYQEHETTQDYLSAISELKKNSVPKEEYAKLREENKQLLKTITDGGYGEQQKTP